MASRTDKFMYLDMEFYNNESFGFINFYNNADEGENIAGGTIGFGDVEERRIGFYGTEHVDTFEIKNFNDIEVHNYNEDDNNNITGYNDSQFIVKANSFKFSLQNPNEIAAINLHTDTLNDFIKIEEERNESDEIIIAEENWNLTDQTGMLFSISGSIGFVSGNKMTGIFNMLDEEFIWMGETHSKDYFNLDGVKVSYEGHVHDDRYYTESETDNLLANKSNIEHIHDDRYFTQQEVVSEIENRREGTPSYKENGYFKYNLTDNSWIKLEYTEVDESYDIPDDALDNTFWWADKEQRLYEKRNGSLYTENIDGEVEIVDELPTPVDGDIAYTLQYERYYQYYESGNYWNNINLTGDEVLIKEITHKSDIDISLATIGDIFRITSTQKYYELGNDGLFEVNRPDFVYISNSNLPEKPSDGAIFEVKGGTFYTYNGSSWIEVDRPMEIPEIHYDNIDEYSIRNKTVFVIRRK